MDSAYTGCSLFHMQSSETSSTRLTTHQMLPKGVPDTPSALSEGVVGQGSDDVAAICDSL